MSDLSLSVNTHPDTLLPLSCARVFTCCLTNALTLAQVAPSKVTISFLMVAERRSSSSLRVDAGPADVQTHADQLGQELSQRVTADTLAAAVAPIRAEMTSAINNRTKSAQHHRNNNGA